MSVDTDFQWLECMSRHGRVARPITQYDPELELDRECITGNEELVLDRD